MKLLATHVKYSLPVTSVDILEEHAWEFDCLCIGHEPPDKDAWPAEISDLPLEGVSIVRVSFTDREHAEKFQSHISQSLHFEGQIEEEEVEDWLEYHRPFAQPITLKKLLIHPVTPPPVSEQDPLTIYLPPGLGFGTGRHETTRSCLYLLEEMSDLHGKNALDFGCGSGILAIAALRLGAKFVQYHDHDPQALRASKDNLAAHGYSHRSEGCRTYEELIATDLLMANILWEPLDLLCEKLVFMMKPGAYGIFSGLLKEQESIFLARYTPHLSCCRVLTEEGWIGILMQKPL
jgi:ribosomal protein L11 methyltransferase